MRDCECILVDAGGLVEPGIGLCADRFGHYHTSNGDSASERRGTTPKHAFASEAHFCQHCAPVTFVRSLHFMASGPAHHATGWAAGVIAAAIVTHMGADDHWHLRAAAAFIAGVLGGSAPDWLEVAWWARKRRLWITHRTFTHWGIRWVALLVWSYKHLGQLPGAAAFGFACGALIHLLADWPNPLGVPWIFRRHSLNLWNSGHCDLIVVGAAWAAAWYFAMHDVPFEMRHMLRLV